MVKFSSGEAISVLRKFGIADEKNVPRNISLLSVTNPSPINTLASFRFNKLQYNILIDGTADDDVEYIISQLQDESRMIVGKLLVNPLSDEETYGMPFKGKEAYLFAQQSEKKRLDIELSERYPEFSRSTIQKYIKAGYVSVNNAPASSNKQEILQSDDISLEVPEATDFSKDSLPILYIDDNVIVIDKPVGVLSHSKGAMNEEFTVADFFRAYTTYHLDSNRPGIIHRLDRDTSGVMIGARNEQTAMLLQKQFADRKTKKTYIAIVEGIPKAAKANIDLPIARNPSAPSTFRVDSKGKSAITTYDVLFVHEKESFIRLQPKTGRTHQLRVHMKYIGTPIKGDKVYGKPSERLYLHAKSLEITIPDSERKIFESTLPTAFLQIFPEAK
jgi:23S rRNA pseudouridine1911/1915/1917 synthase